MLQAEFLPGKAGRLFVMARVPQQGCPGVLFVPPFAEEMNKTRHLFAQVAALLAERGIGSLWVDLSGTGDSEGEFVHADWEGWIEDLAAAREWSAGQGVQIDRLLGVRLGCALAAQIARRQEWQIRRTAFWQPVGSGARALDQFLRLRVAATLMQKDGKETVAGLRARLKGGESLEVAGYELSPTLGGQLDRIELSSDLTASLGDITWFEIVRSADAGPSMPSSKIIEGGRAQGLSIDLQAICGEPFWSSVEIVQNPELVKQTVHALGAAA